MQHRRTIRLVTFAFAGAGLAPAAVAGASDRSPTIASEEYCAAHLALEAAVSNDDPDDDGPAVEAAQAAAPEEVADALTAAIENVPDGPPTPEFYEAYGSVIDWVRGNCGFAELEVLAQDYSFGGIGGEVPAGPTIIDLVNEGMEYHEFVLVRRSEEATQPVEELLALPDEELGSLVTSAGAAFAAPGATGSTVVDLTPGDYIALCFIPVGATEEAMAEMMATAGSVPPESVAGPGTAPVDTVTEGTMIEDSAATMGSMPPGDSMAPGELGPPHFTQGMFVEFTVVEDGTTDTGAGPVDTSGGVGATGDTTADTSDTPGDTTADTATETTTAGTTAETTGDTSTGATTAGTDAGATTTG